MLLGLAHTIMHRWLTSQPETWVQFSRELRKQSVRHELFERFAAPIRVELLVLYGFAVLHKLNRDFLDPEVSCAPHLLKTLAVRLPFLPTAQWACLLSIWATLLIEACIPVLLYFRQSRNVGIVLGWGFHSLLGLHSREGLYSFSAMLFALFFLFTPESFAADLVRLKKMLCYHLGKARSSEFLRGSVGLGLVFILGGGIWLCHNTDLPHSRNKGLITWIVWGLGLIVLYVATLAIRKPAEAGSSLPSPTFCAQWRIIYVVPALVALNGLSPYLGLKTETSFSMFSNLRTEGKQPNHLFMPGWLKLTSLQDDLVEVTASNNQVLQDHAKSQLLLPYFEFRRECSEISGDFWVNYRRNDIWIHFERANIASTDPALVDPPPWLLTKFLTFRPVDPSTHAHCSH